MATLDVEGERYEIPPELSVALYALRWRSGGSVAPLAMIGGRWVSLPRLVAALLGRGPGPISYANGDPTNLTAGNLICTPAPKRRNRRGIGASGIDGVTWRSDRNAWGVRIHVEGKRHDLGSHPTREAARWARDTAEVRLRGAAANLSEVRDPDFTPAEWQAAICTEVDLVERDRDEAARAA